MLAGTAHRDMPALINCSLHILESWTFGHTGIYRTHRAILNTLINHLVRHMMIEHSLSRCILHCYTLGVELQVCLPSNNLPISESLLRIVDMTVEYLLRKSQGPVSEDFTNDLQLFL